MAFDPQKHLMKLKGKDYLEVKWRLVWLREEHPNAMIATELVDLRDNHAVFKATVTLPEGASATGFGSEDSKGFADFIEKAETKALGRALAGLGYGTQFCDDMVYGAEEGRVVDSPVSRPADAQRRANGDRQRPQGDLVDAPPDVDRAMKRVHAVAAEHGISHDDLHNWAVSKNLDSLRRATARQLDAMSDYITKNPDDAKAHFLRLATGAALDASTPTSEPLPGVSGGSHRDAGRWTR